MSYLQHKPFVNQYWFPVAALYAAIFLPLSIAGQMAWLDLPLVLSSPLVHGHEMIFGFAMAVVAGYILGPQTRLFAFSLIAVWLLARLSFIWQPFSILSLFFNALFFTLLLSKVIPVFLRAIRRWTNGTVGVVAISLAIIVIAVHGVVLYQGGYSQHAPKLLFEAILLLSTLMFFMGGRMIGPAVGVYLQDEKGIVIDRIQLLFEKAGLLILLAVLLANIVLADVAPVLVSVLLTAAAWVILVRLYRWKVWLAINRADLASLVLGYCWLAVSWLLIAWALLTPSYPLSYAYHGITVGALGTLTFTVMARGRMHKALRNPNALPWVFTLVLLISAAAVLRLSLLQLDAVQALLVASLLWSTAFAGLFAMMMALAMKAVK